MVARMDMNAVRWVAGFAAAVLVSMPASAAAQQARLDEESVTPRMLALGGRAEATGTSTSSMFGNPAMMTATRVYHSDAYFLYDPSVNRFMFGSAVVDSTRQFVSAGLAYAYSTVNNGVSATRFTHETRLNVALALSQSIGLGVSARYLSAGCSDPMGREGCSPPVPQGSQLNTAPWAGFVADVGLFIRPMQYLNLSATGRNLSTATSSAAPIGMNFSAALNPFPTFTLVADVLVDFRYTATTTARYSAGAELFIANHFPIRLGYMYDDTRGARDANGMLQAIQAITAGLGYVDESFGLEVSLRQAIVPDAQTTVMATLRYFYRAAM